MTSHPALASVRGSRFARMAGALAVMAVLAGCSGAPKPGLSIASRDLPPLPKSCAVSPMLVSSCRPWLGAAASGNPGASDNKIAQFQYLERLLGHHLDIFRDFNAPPGSGPLGVLPLNRDELYFVKQPGTYVDVNWKPVHKWALADGGDAAVNAEIAQAADNIKAVAPHKIFLTIWWEPQNDVSGGTDCPGLVGSAGTPAQYILMWRNVEKIFKAQGADNVIWAMDYMSDPKFDCLVPQLWPGNNLVDWVFYDSYDRNNGLGTNWYNTVGRFYNLLHAESSPSVDFDAKPWGLGEFGVCQNSSVINSHQFYLQAKHAIESDAYPKLRMYIMYAADTGNHAGPGCLTDYDSNGQPDATKNAAVKAMVNLPVFNR